MNNLILDTPAKAASLASAWAGIQKAKPGIRIREAAKELGASEAQLLATKVGEHVIRLKGPWGDLLKRLPELGRVMSLTRNDSCILEHKGPFEQVSVFGEGTRSMATVIGPIETRVFFNAWHVVFAATEEKSDRVLKSIQVFDKSGEAITKIYLQDKGLKEASNEEAFYKIIDDFRSDDQSPEQEVQPYTKEQFADDVDTVTLLAEWSALKDTHDFFGMLKRHKVDRYDALKVATGRFTHHVNAKTAAKQILDEASLLKLPIMIFAGNRGNLQIHQDKVRTIRVLDHGHTGAESWLNVLDPDFNMHLKQNDIHTAWVVKKPTNDGVVTSVELFDKNKNLVIQFFGLRKPGIQENETWTRLVEKLLAE
ncbi:MAG TPA: ChuX/HutX family heme-like substrate-binding protein [Cyclobacteriaceae bacterium]|nr:ChuX/HutX family heme-like substrate-binding protein [Cyclobacteriaceae bacterium]